MELTVDEFFVKVKPVSRLSTVTQYLNKNEAKQLELLLASEEPLGFSACARVLEILNRVVKKSKGRYHIASQTDGDDADVICYDNSVRYVDRQIYYLCRGSKNSELYASEKLERDN